MQNQYQLRDYQKECIDKIDALPDGSRVIVALATGLGKTLLISKIKRAGRMLILSHRDELVRQPEKYFDCPFGIEKAEQHSNGEDVVSASVQTLSRDNRLTTFAPETFDIIVVDEAHHAAAATYRKVLGYFKPKKLIGLTATPKRGDNVRLDDIFDEVIYSRDLLWGIQNKYLSPVCFMSVSADIDISDVAFSMGDFNQSELASAIDNEVMYTTIARTYLEHCLPEHRHTVVYCLSVAGCKGAVEALRRALPVDQVNTIAMVTGETPDEERRRIEKDFTDGKIMCIVNCMILTEGTDLPVIDAIIIARPSANIVLYTQIAGRGSRQYPNKTDCLILDITPTTRRRICSAVSLIGCDWEDLTEEQRRRIREEGADLEEMAREVREAVELRSNTLITRLEELNVFEEMLARQTALLEAGAAYGLGGLVHAIVDDNEARINETAAEDGSYDFKGLKYTIGKSDDERYVIKGDPKNTEIHLRKPDMLGYTVITMYVRTLKYVSEPIKMEKAIDMIKYLLTQNYSSTSFMWDEITVKSWSGSNATSNQLVTLHRLVNKAVSSVDDSLDGVNKYSASLSIAYLTNRDELAKRIKELRKAAKAFEKRKTDAAAMATQKERLPAQSFEAFFDSRFPEYKQQMECKGEDITLSFHLKSVFYTDTGAPASIKQKQLFAALCEQLTNRGGVADIDLVHESESWKESSYVSVMIDILKKLNDLSWAAAHGVYYGQNPVFQFRGITEQLQKKFAGSAYVELRVVYTHD